jgi:drug/metabolite transporter (DMT)-like permease
LQLVLTHAARLQRSRSACGSYGTAAGPEVTSQRAWAGFWVLAVIWGSSFLFIRIGVEQLSTFQLVFIRTGIAAVGLNIVVYLRGKRLPTNWQGARDVAILGVVNTVIPFALITWGEKSIESGLAAVLQATAALFTMIVAHVVFADERVTRRTAAGLVFGFAGVVVLASRSTAGDAMATDGARPVVGQLAIVVASFCYAVGGVYSRKAIQRRLEPIVAAAGAMTVAAMISGPIAYLLPSVGGAAPAALAHLTPGVLGAILTLGVLNTFIAYLIFYATIETLGAGKASMVTYVIPAVGLTLGALFLHEPVDVRLLTGAAMIVGSIGICSAATRKS